MSRIIKFKGWNPHDKVIATWEKIKEHKGYMYDFVNEVTDNLKMMQFTNCFDKNGSEIYEGDIVKNSDGKLFEIQCYFGNFVFFDDDEVVYLTENIVKGFEVVGNIHQNPELIEVPVDLSVFNNKK